MSGGTAAASGRAAAFLDGVFLLREDRVERRRTALGAALELARALVSRRLASLLACTRTEALVQTAMATIGNV